MSFKDLQLNIYKIYLRKIRKPIQVEEKGKQKAKREGKKDGYYL